MILALNVAATDKNSRHPNIQTSVLFIFYAKTLIKVVFEHFADRPQPLYDSFTGKLAPSTLLLVNVLTEKDVDHVFAKKNQRKHRNYTSTMNNLDVFFRQIKLFIRFHLAFYFQLQTL